jgi:hypothetical protein
MTRRHLGHYVVPMLSVITMAAGLDAKPMAVPLVVVDDGCNVQIASAPPPAATPAGTNATVAISNEVAQIAGERAALRSSRPPTPVEYGAFRQTEAAPVYHAGPAEMIQAAELGARLGVTQSASLEHAPMHAPSVAAINDHCR